MSFLRGSASIFFTGDVLLVSQGAHPFLWEDKRLLEYGSDQQGVWVQGPSIGMAMVDMVTRTLGRPHSGSWPVKVWILEVAGNITQDLFFSDPIVLI